MTLVRAGYKRLYNSHGCKLQSDKAIEIALRLSEFQCGVYIGRDPKLGISAASGDLYYVMGESASIGSMSFGREDVSRIKHIDLLTEVICSKEIEVDDSIATGFYSGDSTATQGLIAIIESQAAAFKENLDLIAGTVGLRFHRQFVIDILAENLVAYKSDGSPTQPLHGNVVEVLEPLSLRDSGADALKNMLQQVSGASRKAQVFGASALRWLLKSWHERDAFSKFMSLFIPLEVILSAVKHDPEEIAQQRAVHRQIQSLLEEHGGQDAEKLLSVYKEFRRLVHPPLSNRFEYLARNAQIDGWKADIAAFKRFNSMRNDIVHNGGNTFELIVSVNDKGETRSLEDIAERYVLWMLFRSKEPYKTRYRSSRTADGI